MNPHDLNLPQPKLVVLGSRLSLEDDVGTMPCPFAPVARDDVMYRYTCGSWCPHFRPSRRHVYNSDGTHREAVDVKLTCGGSDAEYYDLKVVEKG